MGRAVAVVGTASALAQRAAVGVRNRFWRTRSRLRRRRHTDLIGGLVVGVAGPPWLAELLRPQFRVVVAEEGPGAFPALDGDPDVALVAWPNVERPWPAAREVGFRSSLRPSIDPGPFIQPITMNPTTDAGRDPAGLPADFAMLAGAGRRLVLTGRPSHRDLGRVDRWLQQTAAAHAAYRRAHERTADDVIRAARSAIGEPAERGDDITVVCVTNRPTQLDALVANYERQTFDGRHLLVITNHRAFDQIAVDARLAEVESANCVHVDQDRSLGHCLNLALDRVESRYLAKFDDDDHYGPDYLSDMLIAHRFAGAAVVGKHSHYALFAEDRSTHLRFPGREFEYTSWVAGGTIVLDLARITTLRFEDRSVGEDGAFLAACQRAGLDIFAADRFNYAQRRTGSNTWPVDRASYLRRSIVVDPTVIDR